MMRGLFKMVTELSGADSGRLYVEESHDGEDLLISTMNRGALESILISKKDVLQLMEMLSQATKPGL